MDQIEITLVILGMAAVTYFPRVLPFFTKIDIQRYTFFKFIPIAIFSSLAMPDLMRVEGIHLGRVIAAVVAVVVAYKTKRMFLTVFVAVFILYMIEKLEIF